MTQHRSISIIAAVTAALLLLWTGPTLAQGFFDSVAAQANANWVATHPGTHFQPGSYGPSIVAMSPPPPAQVGTVSLIPPPGYSGPGTAPFVNTGSGPTLGDILTSIYTANNPPTPPGFGLTNNQRYPNPRYNLRYSTNPADWRLR
jgi:hypothetical protein